MVQRVYLHPGPPKTGTTYLQSLLYANENSLLPQHVSMIGSQAAHFAAANDLLRARSRRGRKVPEGAWPRMREAVLGYDGHAIMSCERYSLLHGSEAQRVAEDLSDAELHVVLTLRDTASVIPARWQEALKNGSSTTWSDYCDRVSRDPKALSRVTRTYSSLRRWATVLPAERIHVVTVPPTTASRTLLLERFCEVVGVDTAQLATLEAPRSNRSLDLVGAEVVRRLNASADVTLSPHVHHAEIKTFLSSEVLSRTHRAERPRLTLAAFKAARVETERIIGLIKGEGIPVVGDLADLSSAEPPDDAPATIEPDAVIDAAVEAIGALAQRSVRRGRRLKALNQQLADARVRPPLTWSQRIRGR